jgi:hypothetical protein
MTDFLFDGPNKIIQEPPGTGNTTYNVERDIYSAWKRWTALSTNSSFEQAFAVEGGTPIGATGLFTGTTFILINGWKIRPADFDHQLFLNGNLYSSDGVATVPAESASATVVINSSVAAQGVASGSGLDNTQATKLDELWKLAGLDASNPLVVDPNSRVVGVDINQTINKDSGTDTVTVTRDPGDSTP